MNYLKKILDFYIFGNIHVALAGFCLTKITMIEFEIGHSLTPLFVGLSIIVSYNFIRFYDVQKKRLNWFKNWFLKNYLKLAVLWCLSALLLAYISFFSDFNFDSVVILIPFAFMTVFYVIPLYRFGKIEVSFRNFPSLKIFSIAIAWSGVTVFFPIYEANIEFTSVVYLEFIQRVLLLIVIILPFDIRDVNLDVKSLLTLPQFFGIFASKIICSGLLIAFVLLESGTKIYEGIDIQITAAIALITGGFLWYASPKRGKYFTRLGVESIPIIWLILIVLFLKI